MGYGLVKESVQRLGAAIAIPLISVVFLLFYVHLLVFSCCIVMIAFLHATMVLVIALAKKRFLKWGVPSLVVSAIWLWAMCGCVSLAGIEVAWYVSGILLILLNLFMMGAAFCGKWLWYHWGWPWLFYILLVVSECLTLLIWASC